MYRKKHIVHRGRYYLWFQASTGGLGTQSPADKGDYCIFFVFFFINSPFDMLTSHRAPLPSVKADTNVNSSAF